MAAEQGRYLERKVDLVAGENMKAHHLVTLMTQMLDARQERLDIVKEIAENNDDGSPADALRQLVEDRRQVGFLPAQARVHDLDDFFELRRLTGRLQEFSRLIVIGNQADAV